MGLALILFEYSNLASPLSFFVGGRVADPGQCLAFCGSVLHAGTFCSSEDGVVCMPV